MGEIFKLFGTIGIDNAEANKAIDETTKKGETSANKITGFFKKLSSNVGNTFSNMGKKLNLSGMHQQFNDLGGKINKTLVSAVKTGAKAIAVGGTAAMAGAGALLIKGMNLAGELEQNMGGSVAVFGEYAGKMQQAGTTAFKTMGLSQSDFLANANKMGSLYQGVGFSVKESMEMSGGAMQRAADVASIMGIDIGSAMEAVGGMAKGNFEMMDNLGVAINDTAIGNYALSKGISKSTSEMSTQEKVGLATQMFMEKTAKYAGNYAKENDTLAGSLQTAKSALSNFMSGAGSIDDVITAGMDFAEVAGKAAMELAPKLFTGISKAVQELIPKIPSIVGSLADGLANTIGEMFGEGAKTKFESLTDTLASAFEGLKSGFEFIVKYKDIFTPIAVGIGAVVAVLGIWNAITTIATAVQAAFNVVLNANPLGIIVLAITAVVSALIYFFTQTETGKEIWASFMEFLSNAWEGIKTKASEIWTAIAEFFTTTWDGIKTKASEIWTAITEFFTTAWEGIKTKASEVWTAITDFLTTAWENIKLVAETVWGAITSFFSTVWEGIKLIFTTVVTAIAVIIGTAIAIWKSTIGAGMQWIWDKIKAVWNGVVSFLTPILETIKNVISTAWNTIKSVTSTIWNGIKSLFSTIWNAISSVFNTVLSSIKNVVSTAWNSIKSVTSSIFNSVKSTASSIWNSIKSTISSVVNGIRSTVSNVFNSIKITASSVWNSIKSTISSVVNGIKSTVSSGFNSVRSTASSVWNGIKNAIMTPINAAKNAVGNAINKIKGFFNFRISWPHIPMPSFGISPSGWKIGDLLKGSIPKLSVNWNAQGGIFDKPTIFNSANGLQGVGEAGREAIIPLNRDNLGMIGQGIAAEMNYSQAAVVSKLDELIDRLEALFNRLDLTVVMDSGELVGAIRKEVDNVLGRDAAKKGRGRAE